MRIGRLGDYLATKSRGIVPSATPDRTFELYSVPSFEEKRPEIVKGSQVGSNKQVVDPGTVLLCKINPRINRAWYVSSFTENPKIASTEWLTFPPHADFEPRYLAQFLSQHSIRDYLAANASGVGGSLMRVKGTTIADLPFPILDRERQRATVAEIERQFSRLDEAVANLQRVKANLKRYKASVLKAAVEGRLVPTEAELARCAGRSFETGEQLLQRILEARRNQWSARGRYVEPTDVSRSAGLPDGWVWAAADQLSDFITKGTTPAASKLSGGTGDIHFLKVYNLTFDGALNHEYKPACVSEATHNVELARSKVRPGDVLINIVGPPLGQVSVVPDHLIEANINQAIARIRPIEPVGSRFIAMVLMCDDIMRWAISRGKTTAGQANLTLELCRALPVPLPPIAEQHRIVAEVDRRLSIAREVEAEVDANLKRARSLRAAMLQASFNGTAK